MRGVASKLTLALALAAWALPGMAAQGRALERSLCVFDVIGANGDVYNMMQDYRVAARQWGVDFQLRPYTDEAVAREDFKAGQCDAVLITGLRNRELVRFAGSLDMMGAIPTYEHLRTAIETVSRPGAAQYMRSGAYEVAGILPAGAVYLYASDRTMRSIDGTPTVEDLAGREIATLSYDEQAVTMVRYVGASVVGSDITSFAGKFNNGSVDICYAPAYAYRALELYRGLGERGRIIDYVLAQLTYQIVFRRDRFPQGVAQKSRDWAVTHFDDALHIARRSERRIPERYWVHIPDRHRTRYQAMFREVRQRLKKQGDVYDPRVMTMLRKIRCHYDPANAECAVVRSE